MPGRVSISSGRVSSLSRPGELVSCLGELVSRPGELLSRPGELVSCLGKLVGPYLARASYENGRKYKTHHVPNALRIKENGTDSKLFLK